MKWLLRILALGSAFTMVSPAQRPADGEQWFYRLTDGAAIMDDCPICDRVSIWHPLEGQFYLVGTSDPNRLIISSVSFFSTAGPANPPYFFVSGNGELRLEKGAPEMTLDLSIWKDENEPVFLTNAPVELPRTFPMIGLEANESPGSLTRVYRIRINAAPIADAWFSTSKTFSHGIPDSSLSASHGDVLALGGRTMKSNSELTALLSIPSGDVGLDAMSVAPGGEIFFSTTRDIESSAHGPIRHGDVVTSRGRVYRKNAQLLAPFNVTDATDTGLDGLHIVSEDEVYFSIAREVTRADGQKLRPGDILSSAGQIIRTEAQLFQSFNPPAAVGGIDAFYVWPSGEVWFSPQISFTASGITYNEGDILSDHGYIAFRNAALLATFHGVDPSIDHGLDAFVPISDAAASRSPVRIHIAKIGDDIEFNWEGGARFVQLERAFAVEGPYNPRTFITTDRPLRVPAAAVWGFHRLRQW